eukprot:jgi/Bigna1/83807/fgenesh1_pg.115_\
MVLTLGATLTATIGLFCCAAIGYICYLTFFPLCIPYPYPRVSRSGAGVYAGSFNPVHDGHIAILRAMRNRFDTIYAVVGYNPGKKYPVSPEQRAKLLKKMLLKNGLPQVKVDIVPGYIWRFAKEKGAVIPAEIFLNFLNILGPIVLGPLQSPMRTVFFQASPAYSKISSTKVRLLRAFDREVKGFVDDRECAEDLARMYNPKNSSHSMTKEEMKTFLREVEEIRRQRAMETEKDK